MELREFIEIGAAKAGSVAALGRLLDLTREATTQAKSHKRKLPADAVMKLADYINVDLRTLTAANELVTEKDEAKRSFYLPFVEHARAAGYVIAVITVFVTLIVTPPPAEASNGKTSVTKDFVLC
jgi:hypothetical protein